MRHLPLEFFVTFFYGQIDSRSGRLTYVNAGHEAALLIGRATSRCRRLESTGTVLGLSDSARFQTRSLSLQPGDVLLAFTDGITDVSGPDGHSLSEADLADIVRSESGSTAAQIAARVLKASDSVPEARDQPDDRTVVVVRYDSPAPADMVQSLRVGVPLFVRA